MRYIKTFESFSINENESQAQVELDPNDVNKAVEAAKKEWEEEIKKHPDIYTPEFLAEIAEELKKSNLSKDALKNIEIAKGLEGKDANLEQDAKQVKQELEKANEELQFLKNWGSKIVNWVKTSKTAKRILMYLGIGVTLAGIWCMMTTGYNMFPQELGASFTEVFNATGAMMKSMFGTGAGPVSFGILVAGLAMAIPAKVALMEK